MPSSAGRGELGPNARFGYPLRGGCEMFVSGLAKRVKARGGASSFGRTLVKLDPGREAGDVPRRGAGRASARFETVGYDVLYPSVPLPDLIRAIPDAPEAVRQAAAQPAEHRRRLRQPGHQPREGDGEALDLLSRIPG